MVDRGFLTSRDIIDVTGSEGRIERLEVRIRYIVNLSEVARLLAVAKDNRLLAVPQCVNKPGYHSGVR